MSETKFEGQVALVTGATRGIGAAIALELATRGLKVVGTATSDEGAARITAALSAFPGCRGATLNVNDAAAAEALIDAIVKEHGALQVLVNNAGITRDMLAMRLKDEDWDAVLDTNLKAVFRMSRAVIRPMMKQPTTASCRKPARPSATPRQPVCPSFLPSIKSTKQAPTPNVSKTNWLK